MQDIRVKQSFVKVAICTMSYLEEKNRVGYSANAAPQNSSFPNKSRNSGFDSLADFEKKDLVSYTKENPA